MLGFGCQYLKPWLLQDFVWTRRGGLVSVRSDTFLQITIQRLSFLCFRKRAIMDCVISITVVGLTSAKVLYSVPRQNFSKLRMNNQYQPYYNPDVDHLLLP